MAKIEGKNHVRMSEMNKENDGGNNIVDSLLKKKVWI